MKLTDVNLTLFFTSGIGLKTWAEVGNLDREVAIYKLLAKYLRSVNFITYGGRKDKQYTEILEDIGIYPIPWSSSTSINLFRLIFHNWKMLKNTDIFKTNQIQGSELPVWLRKRFGKKLIVRCGYLYSRFAEKSNNKVTDYRLAYSLENYVFNNADIVVVTTEFNRNYIIEKYGINPNKIFVIPNYVNTDIFIPKVDLEKEYDIVFVGRTGKQKNLKSLFESLVVLKKRGLDFKLLVIGGCSTDQSLHKMAVANDIKVSFHGNVRNYFLPDLLNKSKIFILPSLYEGHPKVLLEAMSCALPCIGTDVEGIRELIKHRETGYLCKPDVESIVNAIQAVLSDDNLRYRIGGKARNYIIENCTLEKVLMMELDAIREVMSK